MLSQIADGAVGGTNQIGRGKAELQAALAGTAIDAVVIVDAAMEECG